VLLLGNCPVFWVVATRRAYSINTFTYQQTYHNRTHKNVSLISRDAAKQQKAHPLWGYENPAYAFGGQGFTDWPGNDRTASPIAGRNSNPGPRGEAGSVPT